MNVVSAVKGGEPRPIVAPVAEADLEAEVLRVLQRATMYRLLSEALTYPCKEGMARLKVTAERLARAMQEFTSGLQHLGETIGRSTVEALASEYVRIFERNSPCSPREGSWNARGIGGRPALLADIAGFYAAFGLHVGEGLGDTEDHLAAELEFLGFLALKLAYAESSGNDEGVSVVREAMGAFWSEHLGGFVVPFTCALEETTTEEFYRAVARLLRAWAGRESSQLGVSLCQSAQPKSENAAEAECFTCPLSGRP